MQVNSNPLAFLRPIYRRLASDRSFHLLSTLMQFDRLIEAVAEQSEHYAASMRQYNEATRIATLSHLAKAESLKPGRRAVCCWIMRKGDRTLACEAVYLPHGIDVRLLENDDIRRTQLVKDGPEAEAFAERLKIDAARRGWAELHSNQHSKT